MLLDANVWWVGFLWKGGGGGEENSFSFFFFFIWIFVYNLFFFNLIRIQNTRLGRQVFYQIHVYRLHYDYD